MTEGCLSAACLTDKQDGLTIAQALLHQYCQSLELLAWDYFRQIQLIWHSIEDRLQVLLKVCLVERLNLELDIKNLLNGLLDEILVLSVP